MEGFTIEGWDDFVENFSKFVDKWADKKKILLQRMANIYHGEVIPHVPVDTSRLVDSITIFGEGIPHDFVEVGTNVEYALYVNDGHVQHISFIITHLIYHYYNEGKEQIQWRRVSLFSKKLTIRKHQERVVRKEKNNTI